ncbi:hypothetical protein DFH06DRAFT_1467263 [Mycena polygramma]|nr:hypothetical protein DFH06DRAFT_1467263 [Mycena polygramma]
MHSALSVRALDSLPLTLHKLAIGALMGSAEDLSLCSSMVENLPPSQALLFLPVFYESLHTDDIPDVDDDLHSSTTQESFGRALRALEGLTCVHNIPPGAFLELWPRYWRWNEFSIAHMASCSDAECQDLSLSFLHFVLPFGDDEKCTSLIKTTAGVRCMVVRGWASSLALEDSQLPVPWYSRLFQLVIHHLSPSDSSGLDEYIEAAGGSFDDLASLLLRHISRHVPSRHTEVSELSARSIYDVMVFIAAADHTSLTLRPSSEDLPLSEALQRLGTSTLTIAACALSRVNSLIASKTIASIFRLIVLAYRLPRGELCLAESIKHGLLYALVACTRSDSAGEVHPKSLALLGSVLPVYAIHCDVLDLMEDAFVGAQEIILATSFASSELWPHWTELVDLVAQRRCLLKRLKSPGRALLKACANMACGTIQEASLFQRCSGCRRVYYYSKLCQTADWRAGGHRTVCTPHSALSINWPYHTSWRDRELLRLLVHQKYESVRWSEIYPQQIAFMYHNPGAAFFTLFIQVWSDFQVAVLPAHIEDESPVRTEWAAAVARVEKSAGRMELHIAEIGDEPRTRSWLLPLWMSDARLYEALAQIVREIPPGIEELNLDEAVPGWEKRLKVLGEDGGIVAIH